MTPHAEVLLVLGEGARPADLLDGVRAGRARVRIVDGRALREALAAGAAPAMVVIPSIEDLPTLPPSTIGVVLTWDDPTARARLERMILAAAGEGLVPLRDGVYDRLQRLVSRPGVSAHLTDMEARLLAYLVDRQGVAVEQATLLEEVWGMSRRAASRTVPTTMRRLRVKLERDPSAPEHLVSVEGGYRFDPVPGAAPGRARAPARAQHRVGRDAEVRTLAQQLAPGGRVVIYGLPGVGKSTLARAAMWRRHDETGAALVEVSLTGCRSLGDVVRAGGSALGLVPPASEWDADAARWLVGAIRGMDVAILLLDGAEEASAGVEALLAALADVPTCVVVTSRALLHVPGSVQVRVAPLAVDESVALLTRLLASGPTALTPAQARWIAEHLDGLPLALELAATRIAQVGASEVLARLEALANEESGTLGMAGVLDATLDLLTEQSRGALVPLSVFRGTFDMASCSAVLGVRADVFEILHELARHALIAPEGGGGDRVRYRMLPTVRQHVRQRFRDERGLAAARAVHAAYFARLARRWATSRDPLEGVVHALPDIQRALREAQGEDVAWMALVVARILARRGPVREALRYDERALEALPHDAHDALRALVYANRAHVQWRLGRLSAAAQDARVAVETARASGADHALVVALSVRGAVAERLDERTGALDEARGLALSIGDREAAAQVALNRAVLASREGDYAQAVALLRGCLADLEGAHGRYGRHVALSNLALFLGYAGEESEAIALLDGLLGDPVFVGEAALAHRTRSARAMHHLARGENAAARAAFEAACAGGESVGDLALAWEVGVFLACVDLADGDAARAWLRLQHAPEIGNLDAVDDEAFHFAIQGVTLRALGRSAEAEAAFTASAARLPHASPRVRAVLAVLGVSDPRWPAGPAPLTWTRAVERALPGR